MFNLRTACGKFYTGKAGDGWTSADKAEAFGYAGRGEADRKAAQFNKASALHGLTFSVEAR